MPIIKRIETDMFRFEDVCDFMVNPVNLVGAPGAGLALEFRKRYEPYVELYRTACRNKTLKFGTVLEIPTDDTYPWDMLCLPTKDHYAEPSDPKNIKRSIEALRTFLKKKENARAVVGLPMLGCGLGTQDYPTVEPIMYDYLDSLDAVTLLSMSPERTNSRPNYLVIIGPPRFGETKDQREKMSSGISRVLEKWRMTYDDFDRIVSGGGVTRADEYICGSLDEKGSIEKSLIYQVAPTRRTIAPVNWSHNKLTAGIRHIQLLAEIGTHFILMMPDGFNNNRMVHIQKFIRSHNEIVKEGEYGHKRVTVLGKNTSTIVDATPVVINGTMDIPDEDD